jgi:hypothetical protein
MIVEIDIWVVRAKRGCAMDPWGRKLNDSGIITAIADLTSRLDSYNEAELSIEDRGYLDRVRAVNDTVRAITENVDFLQTG